MTIGKVLKEYVNSKDPAPHLAIKIEGAVPIKQRMEDIGFEKKGVLWVISIGKALLAVKSKRLLELVSDHWQGEMKSRTDEFKDQIRDQGGKIK